MCCPSRAGDSSRQHQHQGCVRREGAAPRWLQPGVGISGQALVLLTWEVLQDGKGKGIWFESFGEGSSCLLLFWELAAFSFLLVFPPPWHPRGPFLPLSRQLWVPWWVRVLRGSCPQELALLNLGLHPVGLGRGEEQWNMIHTWEQKITCICHCFHVYSVEKILERRILILPEEKGGKKKASFGNGCLDLMQ